MEALYAAANEKTGRLVAEREGVKGVIDFLDRAIGRAEVDRAIGRAEGILCDDGNFVRRRDHNGFLHILYNLILSKPPAEVHCQWSDDGKSVVILDAVAFARDVCPRYYRHSNFDSFKRNMNMYQFVKSKPRGYGSQPQVFTHKHFLRGREDLLVLIRRRPQGGPVNPWRRRGVSAAEAAPAEDAAPASRARPAPAEDATPASSAAGARRGRVANVGDGSGAARGEAIET